MHVSSPVSALGSIAPTPELFEIRQGREATEGENIRGARVRMVR